MRRANAGFSLIEVMVATAAVATMSLCILSVTQSSASAMKTNAARLDSYEKTVRAFQKLERYVRGASLASLQTVPPGFLTPQPLAPGVEYDNLTFQTMVPNPMGPNALPALSAPIGIFLQPSATDPQNGVDDDNDGIVDGQYLVLSRPGQPPESIASGILSFATSLQGQTVTLSVGVAVRQPDGSVRAESRSRTMEIRNG